MNYFDDEYNYVRITNEEQQPSFEFGSIPSQESASYNENRDSIRDEVNDNPVENSSNHKKEEKKEKKENKENQENQDNQSSHSSNASSSHAGGAASGGIATAGAAVAAAACLVTGIVSIGAGPMAPEVNNLKLTPHETSIECVFDIFTGTASYKYKVELYNDENVERYNKEAIIGHNELEFDNLHSSTEYTFEIFRGTLNEESQEYNYESIYTELVSTLDISEGVVVSFDPIGRYGYMSSYALPKNSEFVLPVCIFVPYNDEIFGGWKINGEGDNIQPGQHIVVNEDTVLVAGWEKLPAEIISTTADSNLFSYFPTSPTSDLTPITNLMGLDFLVQNVYASPTSGTLNFSTDGGFVSTTRPFMGSISNIIVNTSEDQNNTSDGPDYMVDYTMSFSSSPIYQKVTDPGETHSMSGGDSYTFVPNDDEAYYFCLSVPSGNIEGCIESILFNYRSPNKDNLEFRVYFDANGGTGSLPPQTITDNHGDLPTADYVGFVAPEGYVFAGWKVNGEGDLLEAGTTIGLSCDILLVAQWKPKPPVEMVTLTFDMNGGSTSNPLTPIQVEKDGEVDLPTKEDLTDLVPPTEIYDFEGWSEEPIEGTLVSSPYTVTKDTKLYAKWKTIGYSLYSYLPILQSGIGDDTVTTNVPDIGEFTYKYAGYNTTNEAFEFNTTDKAFFANKTALPGGVTSVIIKVTKPITLCVLVSGEVLDSWDYDTYNAYEFTCPDGEESHEFEVEYNMYCTYFRITAPEGSSDTVITDIIVKYKIEP